MSPYDNGYIHLKASEKYFSTDKNRGFVDNDQKEIVEHLRTQDKEKNHVDSNTQLRYRSSEKPYKSFPYRWSVFFLNIIEVAWNASVHFSCWCYSRFTISGISYSSLEVNPSQPIHKFRIMMVFANFYRFYLLGDISK